MKRTKTYLKLGYGALSVLLVAMIIAPEGDDALTQANAFQFGDFNIVDFNLYDMFSASALDPKTHNIVMTTKLLPTGQLAYQMVSHNIDGNDVTEQRYGTNPTPSIPGPAIIIDEGDEVFLTLENDLGSDCVSVHVHGVHYSINDDGTLQSVNKVEDSCAKPGQSKTYHWSAGPGTAGTWPYHDHTFGSDLGSEDAGLFGAVIVNEPKTKAMINGKISSLYTSDIDKEYVLYMVETTFWGLEIDNTNGGRQTPLWINPTLVAQQNDEVRFHVVGLGTAFHTFHMHAHRWLDQGTTDVIDVKNIGPLTRHVFTIKAGESVGEGDWMYHCHVFAHMQAGMTGIFRVTADGGPSIPGDSPFGDVVSFEITDEPGTWFKNRNPINIPNMSESLAVAKPGDTITFDMTGTNTVHTVTSLIYPENAQNMPFDQSVAFVGGAVVELEDPGMYVFTCKVHPYMFAAVLVDDENTDGIDVGENLVIVNGIGPFPSSSPLTLELVKDFFVATNPDNWQDYDGGLWNVSFPSVNVRLNDGIVVNLDTLNIAKPLVAADPLHNGIGEVWVNTQFEKTEGKSKYGSSTALNATTWKVTKKFAQPEINMNHPHNMWTNTDQSLIYQTQWFDQRLTVFDRNDGTVIRDMNVGDAPSHIVTNPVDDKLYVALNGASSDSSIAVIDPEMFTMQPNVNIGASNPHGHWISSDGTTMVTPNAFTGTSSIHNFVSNTNTVVSDSDLLGVSSNAFGVPIATGMHPSGDKYYVANLLDQTVTCVSIGDPACVDDDGITLVQTKPIVLIANLPNLTSGGAPPLDQQGPAGLLPIQTPVSPDGKYVVTATLLPSITVIDTETDTMVLSLPCDAGCHGANFGAHVDGGWNVYVSSKFSNALIVFDVEDVIEADKLGNNNGILDGTEADGKVGRVIVSTSNAPSAMMDDVVSFLDGMGGQGVLAIPNPYSGWIEHTATSDTLSPQVQNWINEMKANGQDQPYPTS